MKQTTEAKVWLIIIQWLIIRIKKIIDARDDLTDEEKKIELEKENKAKGL